MVASALIVTCTSDAVPFDIALRQIGVDLHCTLMLALYDVRRRASGVVLVYKCNILMIGGRAMNIVGVHW